MTRAQLVQEAAENLLLVTAGNSLDAEDAELIDGKVDALFAQLRVDGIVDIDDEDAIPDEYFDALGQLLANMCASKFGQGYSEDRKMIFEKHLRRTASTRPTYETLKATYY